MTHPFPTLSVQRVAHLLAVEVPATDVSLTAVSIDSRQITEGALFVALTGPHFDGHDFIAAARTQGARAALVSRRVDDPLSQIVVPDTRLALGQLAAQWRTFFTQPVIALTGSNGKTTVKEMIAAILRTKGNTLATVGNLNNDLGVPLTLLRLRAEHDYAVIEMGANHHGEIAYLTGLVHPDVAIINNAGPCHLDGFGDLDGVARAKGEIFQGLAPNGIAIINRDDAHAPDWVAMNKGRQVISFGLDPTATVRAEAVDVPAQRFTLATAQGHVTIQLPVPGLHNVRNALAAAAATMAVGATLENVRDGLHAWQGVQGRMQRLVGTLGQTIIHDAYNANPASLAAALHSLDTRAGRTWLILGDMRELGPHSEALHTESGHEARRCGCAQLFTVGEHSRCATIAFGAGGAHYDSMDALQNALHIALQAASEPESLTLLVKGSRGMRMERVIAALTDTSFQEHH